MKYLMLSDIHANDLALAAVLEHAQTQGWDECIFLGDLVGYYPQANEAANRLKALEPLHCILGNHDSIMLDMEKRIKPLEGAGNITVQHIIKQQLSSFTPENLSFVKTFKNHVVISAKSEEATEKNIIGWEMTHGSLRQQWAYMTNATQAKRNAELLQTPLCFVGHTHVPVIYSLAANTPFWRTKMLTKNHTTITIQDNAQTFFNPGSVGQPRDGIPLASYAIFDDKQKTIDHFRVPFDIPALQEIVIAAGYPKAVAQRLSLGR